MTFAQLWNNHPNVTGEPALLDKKVYENQCAINLSASLIRAGIDLKSYSGTKSWEKGKPTYPIRAQELANWLASGASRLPTKTEKFTAKEAFGRIDGKKGMTERTGIVFFQNYWGAGAQGDHIDLWNGSRLTDWRTWARINIRVGEYGLHNFGAGSDFQKSQSVWFWAVA
ncbi:type VI secretion system amidase effector protein Tae4 [Pseudorhodoferax sp.]|uniref:type VI secretion system amidase effector protein Tae4 n=1 Tax=Pseudorhodoferax sp. TaxID=1993553 RepID=UPI002DD62247|nr:type VI secretion system amidase effector protein Tae4 [Pseudorhodoferax sp.]